MTESLRRSRMWRAYWTLLFLSLLGLLGGMAAWIILVLAWNGTLRSLVTVARQGLANLGAAHWLIAFVLGGILMAVMLWVWAELMRRTHYLSEEELGEMTTKWFIG